MTHTLEDVMTATAKAVAAHPNRRNPRFLGGACVYTGKNGSHCIAGQVLLDLGYEIPEYGNEWNGMDVGSLVKDYVGMSSRDRHGTNYDLTPEAVKYLETAQSAFDNGQKWSTAMRVAERDWAAEADDAQEGSDW